MSAIAVSLLTPAAMLGVRMRRGLQQAADMSIALAPASADNILELKAQESIVRGQVGWSQQSSKNSRPLTLCYAGPLGASGAAYHYCVQSLGCTAEEAAKVERNLLPKIAESLTLAQAD